MERRRSEQALFMADHQLWRGWLWLVGPWPATLPALF